MMPLSLLPGLQVGSLPPAVLVASDLHLSDSLSPREGKSSGRSRADDAFCRWLDHYQADARGGALLVLNGDTFDFQRVRTVPRTHVDFERWKAILPDELRALASRKSISRNEKVFGFRSAIHKAIWKLHVIGETHHEVLAALARWLETGGKLLLVKGNHDLELHWREVCQAVIRELESRASDSMASGSIADRVFFSDEGVTLVNIWIEHGHRWESAHAVAGPPTLGDSQKELRLPRSATALRYLVSIVERQAARFGQKKNNDSGAKKSVRIRGPVLATVSLRVVPPVVAISMFTNGSALWYVSLGVILCVRLTLSRMCAALLSVGENVLAMKSVTNVSDGAKQVLSLIQSSAWPQPVYAVMGHTHVQQVDQFVTSSGSAVYVNTGIWNPRRAPKSRRANDVHYGFVRFFRDQGSAYSLSSLVWDDAAGITRPATESARG